jgi:hypothetical protein
LQGGLSVDRMCLLAQVSRASFYRYLQRGWQSEEEIALRSAVQSIARVSFTTSPVAVSSIANVCWRACKSHPIIRISASFDPSTVGVNTEQSTRVVAGPTSLWHQSGMWIRGLPSTASNRDHFSQADGP